MDSNQSVRHADSEAKEDIEFTQQAAQYVEAVRQASEQILLAVKVAVEKIHSVLKFEGGWMTDLHTEETDANRPYTPLTLLARSDPETEGAGPRRQRQLRVARAEWVPTLTKMLHQVYFETANWACRHGHSEDQRLATRLYKTALKVGWDRRWALCVLLDMARKTGRCRCAGGRLHGRSHARLSLGAVPRICDHDLTQCAASTHVVRAGGRSVAVGRRCRRRAAQLVPSV